MMRPRKARPAGPAGHPTPAHDATTRDASSRDASSRDASSGDADIGEERLTDLLVELVGGVLRERVDPTDPAHARFYEWMAREAREAQTPEERARTAREADAFALDMMRRLREMDAHESRGTGRSASTPAIRRETGEPSVQAPRGGGIGAEAVREAARAGYVARFALSVAAGAGRELWDEPVDAWVEAPAGVPPGMHVALTVRGDSMGPLLHDGDTLLVRVGTDVAPGDVVVARRPDHGYVVKRVAALHAEAMRLTSDNPEYEDVLLPRDPALLVGVVVLRWCAH